MATWKKIVVSGSQAHLTAVTASNFLGTTNPGVSFIGTSSYSVTASFVTGTIFTGPNAALSASYAETASYLLGTVVSSSVVSITDTTTGTGPYYVTFVDATSGHPAQRVDSNGLTYNATDNTLTLAGDLAVNGGDITTNQSTFTLLAGASTTLNIGTTTTTSSFGGRVVVGGDLVVNGETTFINTTNLLVEDQFVLFGSGSVANKDGGIVIQSAAGANSGYGLIYDTDTDRWYMQDAASAGTGLNAISYTTTAGVVGVQRDTAVNRPADGTGPLYGGTTNGWGNMYIESDGDFNIWIYV